MNTANLGQYLQGLVTEMKGRLKVVTNQSTTVLELEPSVLLPVMRALRQRYGFNHLANLSAVDYQEEFELVYHLYTIPENHRVVVKTRVDRQTAAVASVFSVYPTADWQEREVFDLMGIGFKGHPNLVRVLLPDDFKGHPLRKDYK